MKMIERQSSMKSIIYMKVNEIIYEGTYLMKWLEDMEVIEVPLFMKDNIGMKIFEI